MRKRCTELVAADKGWLDRYLDARTAFDPTMRGIPVFPEVGSYFKLPIERVKPAAPPPDKPVNLPANYARTLELMRRIEVPEIQRDNQEDEP